MIFTIFVNFDSKMTKSEFRCSTYKSLSDENIEMVALAAVMRTARTMTYEANQPRNQSPTLWSHFTCPSWVQSPTRRWPEWTLQSMLQDYREQHMWQPCYMFGSWTSWWGGHRGIRKAWSIASWSHLWKFWESAIQVSNENKKMD